MLSGALPEKIQLLLRNPQKPEWEQQCLTAWVYIHSMSLLLKDGAAISFRARVEGLCVLNSLSIPWLQETLEQGSQLFLIGPGIFLVSTLKVEALQSRANWDSWAPHSGVRKCEIISVRRILLDSLMLLVDVCICVCLCTEPTIIIHGSCVL